MYVYTHNYHCLHLARNSDLIAYKPLRHDGMSLHYLKKKTFYHVLILKSSLTPMVVKTEITLTSTATWLVLFGEFYPELHFPQSIKRNRIQMSAIIINLSQRTCHPSIF